MSDPRLPKVLFPPTDENGESSLPLNAVLPDPRLFTADEAVEVLGVLYHPVQKDGVWGWETRDYAKGSVIGRNFAPWEPPDAR